MRLIERLSFAVELLRGRARIENDRMVCNKEHVGAGEVRIKRAVYDALVAGDIERGVLRGAVATLDAPKYEQVRKIVNDTLNHTQNNE